MNLQRLFTDTDVPSQAGYSKGIPGENFIRGRTPVPNLTGSPIPTVLPIRQQDPNMLTGPARSMQQAGETLAGFGKLVGDVANQAAYAEAQLKAKEDKLAGINAANQAETLLVQESSNILTGTAKMPAATHQDYIPRFQAAAQEITERVRSGLTPGAQREFDVKWGSAYLIKLEAAEKHRVDMVRSWAHGSLEQSTQEQVASILRPDASPRERQDAWNKLGEVYDSMRGLIPDKELSAKKKEASQYVSNTLASRAAFNQPEHFAREGYKDFPFADQSHINSLRAGAQRMEQERLSQAQSIEDRQRQNGERVFRASSDDLAKKGTEQMNAGADITPWLKSNERLLTRESYESLTERNRALIEARKREAEKEKPSNPNAVIEREVAIRNGSLRSYTIIAHDDRLSPTDKAKFFALIDAKLSHERSESKADQRHAESLRNSKRNDGEKYLDTQIRTAGPLDFDEFSERLLGMAKLEYWQQLDKDPNLDPLAWADELAARYSKAIQHRSGPVSPEAILSQRFKTPQEVWQAWKDGKINTAEANARLRALERIEKPTDSPDNKPASGSRKPQPKKPGR